MLTGILEPTHLIIILIVALVVLGPKRLPDAGRALGQGLSEFKRSLSGEHQGNPPVIAPPAVPAEDDPGSGATPG
jgi:sec-independent protein translocase protein TatA